MNELVKGQWWFSLKTNYWCWEGTAVWLGSNSPATPAEDSKPVHPPHTLPTTQQPPTLLHPITPWDCCQPGRWGETGSGKDKTPSHRDLNWNKAKVKRGYWESDYSRKSERGWERMRVAHVWKLAYLLVLSSIPSSAICLKNSTHYDGKNYSVCVHYWSKVWNN